MKAYGEYWTATLVRGLLAIVAGTGILILPQMAETVLLRPFALTISVLCLAAYGTIDSAIVLICSFMIPRGRSGRFILKVQGICGAVLGVLLFAYVYDRLSLQWFIFLAAAQATSTAIAEFVVARDTASHHGARWCYAASFLAAASAVALLLAGTAGDDLSPRKLAWLLFAYIEIFGFNLFAISARMLFAERQALHIHPSPAKAG
jgi:uncharacterized membrane protein HdeD (DUF308 family)